MKVFTAQQMRDFDARATDEYSIPSIVLMENAALRVVEFLEWKFGDLRGKRAVVFCGKGNNGGDGFAIARHLTACGCYCRSIFVGKASELKGDAAFNFDILKRSYELRKMPPQVTAPPYEETVSKHTPLFFWNEKYDFAVDALLGTGFKGELRDVRIDWELINIQERLETPLVSVDIPSGIESDTGARYTKATRSDYTITFAAPKRGMLLRHGIQNCGEIWVGDIGTAHNQMLSTQTDCETITREKAHSLLPHRPLDAHKGTAGKVVVVGGSRGMSGAPALAATAALRVGAGLCAACVPDRVLDVFAANVVEATGRALACDEEGRLVDSAADALPEIWRGADVCALGPGLSRAEGALNFARRVVRECPLPLIIDADALYCLRAIADAVKARSASTILTPHPGEMAELMESDTQTVNDHRLETAIECAQKYNAIVVLKGARSVVATPDGKTWFNLTGNAGMATGGSGDILTGTIAGLLAQTKDALNATLLGVYLHGLAGDIEYSMRGNGLVASDIASALPAAILDLQNRPHAQRINGRLRKLE